MQVQSYLNFDGRCEEAIEFYKRARFGIVADRFGVSWMIYVPPEQPK